MRRKRTLYMVVVAWMIYGLLVIYPIAPVLLKGLQMSSIDSLYNARRLKVLLRTCLFSGSVAMLVSLLGFLVASSVTLQHKYLKVFFVIMGSFLVLPGYIQAMGWGEFGAQVLKIPVLTGGFISILVQSLYLLPMGMLISYYCIQQTSVDYLYHSQLDADELRGGYQTMIKLNHRSMVITGGIVFLLCLNDYTIPSLFAYNTYPVELMAMFSAGLGLEEIIFAALPIVLMSMVILGLLFKIFAQYFDGQDLSDGRLLLHLHRNLWVVGLILMIFIIQVVIPSAWIIAGVGSLEVMIEAINRAYEDIMFSLTTALLAAFIMVMVSLVIAYIALLSSKFRVIMTMMMVMQFALPGTILGLITVKHYAGMPMWLYYSMVPTSHMYILRFLPVVYLIIFMGMTAMAKEDLYAIQMETTSHLAVFIQVIKPKLSKLALVAGLIGFALSMADLSGSILTVPPGSSTLTVTIYNYMHYGNSQVVLGLALFTLVICAGLIGLCWVMIKLIESTTR